MNIELIPAIDIIGGQCVRLTKGDYDQKKVYDDNPAEVAKHFEKLGFKRLHVVDLDGAKSKHIVNDNVLKAITSATSLTVDFGGGIKTEEDIEKAFDAGAAMVTVGSIAVTNPELFLSWIDKFGARAPYLGSRRKKRQNIYQRLEGRLGRRLASFPQTVHRQGCAQRALHRDQQGRNPSGACHRTLQRDHGSLSRPPSDCLGRCKLQRGYRCFRDSRHSCGGVRQSFLRGKNRHRQIGSLNPP